MKIDYLIGTRPEVIRSAAIIKELTEDTEVTFRLLHTGQHFDENMDGVFFKELGVPLPDFNLNIGALSQGNQFAKIIVGLEEYYKNDKPDILIVFGDTNSSLAAAIIASKLEICLAHIEAGCREYEMDMPEEVNRRLIDHSSRLLLPVSEISYKNLLRENVPGDSVFVGDPLWTVFSAALPKAENLAPGLLKSLGLETNDYVILTTHRGKNVDDQETLFNILEPLAKIKNKKVVFPVHPRTRKNIQAFSLPDHILDSLVLIDPVSYYEMLALVRHSKFAVTDSGGLQKEVFWLHKPCLVVRDHTAWVEPILFGTSFLVKPDMKAITKSVSHINSHYEDIVSKFNEIRNPYINGDRDITRDTVKEIKNIIGSPWRDDSPLND